MTERRSYPLVSRRTALAGLGLTLAATARSGRWLAAAQESTPGPPPATPSAPGQTVTINGAAIYYEIHGPAAGKPGLLLHGSLSSWEDFSGLAPALVAGGYQVIAMAPRGRGRSSGGDAPTPYDQMTADTLGLLDHL